MSANAYFVFSVFSDMVISGAALSWFRFNLKCQSFKVSWIVQVSILTRIHSFVIINSPHVAQIISGRQGSYNQQRWSERASIFCGVPEGFVLGPLIIKIFIYSPTFIIMQLPCTIKNLPDDSKCSSISYFWSAIETHLGTAVYIFTTRVAAYKALTSAYAVVNSAVLFHLNTIIHIHNPAICKQIKLPNISSKALQVPWWWNHSSIMTNLTFHAVYFYTKWMHFLWILYFLVGTFS